MPCRRGTQRLNGVKREILANWDEKCFPENVILRALLGMLVSELAGCSMLRTKPCLRLFASGVEPLSGRGIPLLSLETRMLVSCIYCVTDDELDIVLQYFVDSVRLLFAEKFDGACRPERVIEKDNDSRKSAGPQTPLVEESGRLQQTRFQCRGRLGEHAHIA